MTVSFPPPFFPLFGAGGGVGAVVFLPAVRFSFSFPLFFSLFSHRTGGSRDWDIATNGGAVEAFYFFFPFSFFFRAVGSPTGPAKLVGHGSRSPPFALFTFPFSFALGRYPQPAVGVPRWRVRVSFLSPLFLFSFFFFLLVLAGHRGARGRADI